MNPIDMDKVCEYIQKHIGSFHKRRLEYLANIKLNDILKRKNPYLFKAKSLDSPEQLVTALLDASLSSSEETIFGEFLERLAVFVNSEVYGGRKSSAAAIDLEFEKDGVIYIVSIKSGPNWGNSRQVSKMRDDFKAAKRRLRTNNPEQNIIAVNGCCYGKDDHPDKGDYLKYCGQRFWSFISGNDDLYTDVIEPLGHRAKRRNEDFDMQRAKIIRKFAKQFYDEFCDENGNILWKELVKFNSQDLTTEWLTTRQAAEKLGIPTGKVLKLIRARKLKALKIGNRWLVHKSLKADFG